MRLHLFLDFDGTISIGDVGDKLVGTFGSFDILHDELLAGEFTVAEYYRRAIGSFRPEATPEAMEEFVQRQEIDAGLAPLLAWSREHSIPATVVSDGFDVYIRPLLKRELGDAAIPIASNTLSYEGGLWKPAFPGASESCSCFCASCKRNVILSAIGDDDVVIYVGDGLSDACAVRYADVVFAKGTLAASCTEEGIPHHTYRSLTEVLIILQRRMRDNDFPRRRQARLARKRAYESE